MTNTQNYTGAKWWKFDFHTHTPASKDFMRNCKEQDKEKVTPKFWLEKFREKGINCVAITDHNSGQWIDKLKAANQKLEQPLHLFPAVEISVNGGVHLLAIFGPDKTTGDIDTLLGAVGYEGTKGDSDGVTTKTLTEVIDIIADSGGIAIPAHANKEKGLFELKGNTLKQALENPNIHAIELCDSNAKPQLDIANKRQWSEVLGSDTHNFRKKNFGNFTWIKMDNPSIDGLKLALIDGKASVKKMTAENPNQHADCIIESLTISNAKYIGKPKELECKFSPFLNTIIGGRGSGKSTLLEFMRFVLRRNNEIPKAIKDDKYFEVEGDNLLTNESELSLIYKKGDTYFRLNWSADSKAKSLEVKKNGQWQEEKGEISSLFPVRIYSQKQIFELAKKPESLLSIIDEDKQVKFADFSRTKQQLTHQYKQIGQKINQITEQIAQKDKLTGELNDVTRQIAQIEESGHKAVLQKYRKCQRQLSSIDRLEKEWQANTDLLNKTATKIAPSDFDDSSFIGQDKMLQSLQNSNNKWQQIAQQINNITEETKKITKNWQQKKSQAFWMKDLQVEISKYEQIKTQLKQQGIDPEKYPFLLQQQTQKQKELAQIQDYETTINELEDKKNNLFASIRANREELTKNRRVFLEQILKDNATVNIEVQPFAEGVESVKKSIREILQCYDSYEKDISFLTDNCTDFEALKQSITAIYKGEEQAQDKRFYQHLHKPSQQESMLNLKLWFAQDNLKITFDNNKKIQTGSAGQKSATLLAFILSYGNEPLLLDQPEDDLDNELIYNLIVKQIRATKNNRQIIIVTHNANIVVNGDAEMVIPMSVGNGQSDIKDAASIQNLSVREKICSILEGGQKAFTQRYKRIHLEQ